jgi:hypothetical membrane protein
MNNQKYVLLGVIGPLVAFFFIAVSIVLSPWFSWQNNALSDLGHSANSNVAPLFNFGLLLSGFIIIIYSLTSFRKQAKYTSYFLILSGLSLQFVATFDEVYRLLHTQVSVIFFLMLALASISYTIEKRSILSFSAFIVGLSSWILYGLKIYDTGIAVPETISAIMVAIWVMINAYKIRVKKI